MKLTTLLKIVICLALLICGNTLTPIATAQQEGGDWDYVSIVAPAQTVIVETPRRSYTAAFQNEAHVFPGGRARGELELTGPNGTLHRFRVVSGRVRFHYGAVSEAVLRLREVDPRDHPRLEITVVVQTDAYVGEDCLIYTTIGTDVRWVAHGRMLEISR